LYQFQVRLQKIALLVFHGLALCASKTKCAISGLVIAFFTMNANVLNKLRFPASRQAGMQFIYCWL
jgi:hypothetical protein